MTVTLDKVAGCDRNRTQSPAAPEVLALVTAILRPQAPGSMKECARPTGTVPVADGVESRR